MIKDFYRLNECQFEVVIGFPYPLPNVEELCTLDSARDYFHIRANYNPKNYCLYESHFVPYNVLVNAEGYNMKLLRTYKIGNDIVFHFEAPKAGYCLDKFMEYLQKSQI